MPSGAKKRKAAKKLHDSKSHHPNHTNNSNNSSIFHSQGSDGVDVETTVKSYGGESKFAETGKEGNPAESHNGDASEERKSSSGSSSSDDDEVDVEKVKPMVGEGGDERVKSDEHGAGAEVVEETIDESIPIKETVKEVVSLNPVSDSVPVEDLSVPDAVDSELTQSSNEVSPPSCEKDNVAFEMTDLGQENVEAKEIPVVDIENRSVGDGHVKESEKVKNSEEQPLISSAPLPVRRTSWMNCCGLFEVISGGSGR